MTKKTVTLTLPTMHLYHLTADPANDTGYTIEQVSQIIAEHGPEHLIEATITTPVPELPTEEVIPDGYNPNARDGDGDGMVQDGTVWERPIESL